MYEWPKVEHLSGEFVELEKIDISKHAGDLYEMVTSDGRSGEDLLRYMPFGPFPTQSRFVDWLREQQTISDREACVVWSKRLRKFVGMYSIMSIDTGHGRAELGSIWFGIPAQRSEVNTQCALLCLELLFTQLRYRRVEWKCDSGNEKSKTAALRLGFVHEGIFRKHMFIKGRNRDTAWFSIIDDEWPTVRQRLRHRLSLSKI
jgi:RimJ/RimL family protein N-acetyltransferase